MAASKKSSSGGNWVTINGVHVLIENGKITKGPAKFIGSTLNDLPSSGKQSAEDKKAALKAKYANKTGGSSKTIDGAYNNSDKMSMNEANPVKSPIGKNSAKKEPTGGETMADYYRRASKAPTLSGRQRGASSSASAAKGQLEVTHYDGFGSRGSRNEYRIVNEDGTSKKISAKQAKEMFPDQFVNGSYNPRATQKTAQSAPAKTTQTAKASESKATAKTESKAKTKSSEASDSASTGRFTMNGETYELRQVDGAGQIVKVGGAGEYGDTLIGINNKYKTVKDAKNVLKEDAERKARIEKADKVAKETGGVALYTGKVIDPTSIKKAGVSSEGYVQYTAKDAQTGKTINLDSADMGAVMVAGIDAYNTRMTNETFRGATTRAKSTATNPNKTGSTRKKSAGSANTGNSIFDSAVMNAVKRTSRSTKKK